MPWKQPGAPPVIRTVSTRSPPGAGMPKKEVDLKFVAEGVVACESCHSETPHYSGNLLDHHLTCYVLGYQSSTIS